MDSDKVICYEFEKAAGWPNEAQRKARISKRYLFI